MSVGAVLLRTLDPMHAVPVVSAAWLVPAAVVGTCAASGHPMVSEVEERAAPRMKSPPSGASNFRGGAPSAFFIYTRLAPVVLHPRWCGGSPLEWQRAVLF